MDASSQRWVTVADSPHDHEREALAFLRARLPDRDPYRVWSNFEFTAPGGQLYEVDALVVADTGLYLIEIKSHPGAMGGDGTTWEWTTPEGRTVTLDNPRSLANRKAKALKTLLDRSRTFRRNRNDVPFVQEAVFLSDPQLVVTLGPQGRHSIYGRDPEPNGDTPRFRDKLGGIVDLLTDLDPADTGRPIRRIDRPPAPSSPRRSTRSASGSAAAGAGSATTCWASCSSTSKPTGTPESPTRTCMRAYGTNCVHEYACEQCKLARPDAAARDRLARPRQGLVDQFDEARRRGWLGEIERLGHILAAIDDKLDDIDRATRRVGAVELTVTSKRTRTAPPSGTCIG